MKVEMEKKKKRTKEGGEGGEEGKGEEKLRLKRRVRWRRTSLKEEKKKEGDYMNE